MSIVKIDRTVILFVLLLFITSCSFLPEKKEKIIENSSDIQINEIS
jgi:hypothetical protein